jgi:hypothetical protein
VVSTQFVSLERRVLRGVLGLRLRDAATGAQVTSGLKITAWAAGTSWPLLAATAPGPGSTGGIYGFRSLPGLEAYVRGEKEATDFCADSGAPPNYILAIEDGARRFLPQLHLLCLPRAGVLDVPLYADPSRSLGPAVGTLRGQVVLKPPAPADPLTDFMPAQYAVVQAQINGGSVVETVCDVRGSFVLFLAYPRPSVTPNQWTVTLRVRCLAAGVPPAAEVPLAALAELPAMGEVLAQPHGQVFDAVGDAAPANAVTRTLVMGADLVVESSGGARRLYVQGA